MKKRTQSGSGRVSLTLLSGAGAAFLTGGVAEAGLVGYIYSDNLNITFQAPPLEVPKNLGFVLGTDFQFRTITLPNHKSLQGTEAGVGTIFQNPLAGDFTTVDNHDMMGLNIFIRDWFLGGDKSAFKFRYGEYVNGYVQATGGGPHAVHLFHDEWIGPGNFFKAGGSVVPAAGGGSWNGNSGYVGFALKDGANGLTADYYYGWMEITAINTAGLLTITIGEYGIMTVANAGIHAGDDGNTPHINAVATPEPATTGLALLALGAAGVLRRRRRKAVA